MDCELSNQDHPTWSILQKGSHNHLSIYAIRINIWWVVDRSTENAQQDSIRDHPTTNFQQSLSLKDWLTFRIYIYSVYYLTIHTRRDIGLPWQMTDFINYYPKGSVLSKYYFKPLRCDNNAKQCTLSLTC